MSEIPAGERELKTFLEPRSIAVVGATGRSTSMFARPVHYLRQFGFEGAIYPINPKYEEIEGLPAYPSLGAIGAPIDLVMIMTPADAVLDVIEECGALGVHSVMVCSSGFAELGSEGQKAQDAVLAAARRHGIRLIGPNSQGLVFSPTGLAATFSGGLTADSIRDSGLAYVGQSGAVGGSFLDLAREQGVGLTAWVSIGNQADVDVFEMALALVERPEIRVMALYVESIPAGASHLAVVSRCAELGVPLVMLQSGRTETGRRAAVSHTGNMLPAGASFDAVARRYGVVQAHDVDEFVDISCAVLRHGLHHGSRVGVVTSSGGAGAIAADQLSLAGYAVPELPPNLQSELSTVVPDYGAVGNPVDVTAQLFSDTGSGFADVGRMLAADPSLDQILMVLTVIRDEQARTVAEQLVEFGRTAGKPVHLCWLAGRDQTALGRQALRAAGMPVYTSLARAVSVIGALATRVPVVVSSEASASALEEYVPPHADLLIESDLLPLLDRAGVRRPRSVTITSSTDAVRAVAAVGGRAVCKVQSPDYLHKTEHGMLRTGLTQADAEVVVSALFEAAAGSRVHGVLVQEQVASGVELLVGVTRERHDLPLLLTVGLGGITAEVFGDVATECLPVDAAVVEAMIRSLRGAPLLFGFRGAPEYDVAAAAQAITALTRAAGMLGERLVELEVNPLIVAPKGGGAVAVDALARLTPEVHTFTTVG
ncbi:acetate--CoA ligase family protein [soil metagenome]